MSKSLILASCLHITVSVLFGLIWDFLVTIYVNEPTLWAIFIVKAPLTLILMGVTALLREQLILSETEVRISNITKKYNATKS